MKNNFKYIKNVFKTLIWPVVFTIGSFLINYIFVAIFNSKEKGTMTDNQFLEYINTLEYQEKLTNYINSKSIIIILIISIIFIPILYKVYKKYKRENSFQLNDIAFPITLGITISLVYNIILFQLNNLFNFTDKFNLSTMSIFTQIICSGILGPILEEFIFRGVVYNNLKKFNKPMTAIILSSVIFSLFHLDIIESIYTFGVSFMLIYLYEKYKTLKAPILMHIFLNTTIILMLNLIVKNFIVFNMYLLIVSIIILLILKIYIKKDV